MALASLFRLARAGYVMAREGVFGIIELPDLPPAQRFALRVVRLLERRAAKDKSADKRLSDALSHLGPSYVKLGQFMATRPDVVGRDMAQDLTALQDQIPPFPTEEARRVVTEQLGRPVEDIFETFGEPVAAASIAQVHPATVRDADGTLRKVAVKILRPGVAERFRRDLKSYYLIARIIERLHPPSRRLRWRSRRRTC